MEPPAPPTPHPSVELVEDFTFLASPSNLLGVNYLYSTTLCRVLWFLNTGGFF